MDITYGPTETKGREFKGDGYFWVLLAFDNKIGYAKLDVANYKAALEGKLFDIYHLMSPGPQGLMYMSSSTKTIEPWVMKEYSSIALLHPIEGENFDRMVKELVSVITVASQAQMPKIAPKLHLSE